MLPFADNSDLVDDIVSIDEKSDEKHVRKNIILYSVFMELLIQLLISRVKTPNLKTRCSKHVRQFFL